MTPIKVGLLPFYVELYDEYLEWMRPEIDKFHETAAKKLEEEGLTVLRTRPCKVENEFKTALDYFENLGAEAVITLHLAYSPSEESEKPLRECKLPIIILDTTPDFEFNPESACERLDFNHGIHGVQDMCNLLVRNGIRFDLFTGHWEKSDVCRRVTDCVRAHYSAKALSESRVGIIGEPFAGMGDFKVSFETLKQDIGIKIISAQTEEIGEYAKNISDERIDSLKKSDEERFINRGVTDEHYKGVTRTSLAIKDWYEKEKLDAFTINFLSCGKNTGFRYMTFDRACRAMEDGIGYAGEGDVLTAALVGALLKSWDNTTFVEMFCPDWKRGIVFLSHMGEYNLRIAGKRPILTVRSFPFGDAGDTYAVMAPMMSGRAVILNIAPAGNGKYKLIAAAGEMINRYTENKDEKVVNGWFKSDTPLEEMLRKFSENGGTHHSAMIYGVSADTLRPMATRFGWDFVII